jgi:gliding motility-associated-like protein
MPRYRYRAFFSLILTVFFAQHSQATHIRAGEVTAELISCQNFSYLFTITGYTDTGSSVIFGGGEIQFGDGTIDNFPTGDFDFFQDLGDEKALNIYFKNHTFPGPGIYKISFREFNRNAGIANMDNSVNTPFYVETVILIDPFLGCNNTPLLLNPPIDDACVGVAYLHNPGAYDPDGDSLSYEFVIPKQNQDVPVVNYRFPHDHDNAVYNAQNEDQTGPATFTIDPITGDVRWDAPGGEGEYNFAFIVREWRKIEGEWFTMGYVTRDMQVIVQDCDNERPELIIPPDTCVVAGTLLQQEIGAIDPDGHDIIMESFGSVYEIPNSPASYTPFPPSPQPSPATLNFRWPTICNHIFPRPYQIRFKALDQPPRGSGPKLADFGTWFVTVVGPPPEGLSASQGNGNVVNLSWDAYTCGNATSIEIWRRVDSNPYEPEHCELGMRENAGYELVEVVDAGLEQYRDNNLGSGLQYGARYCYRLVAVFETLEGMKSVVSAEACVQLEEYLGDFGAIMTNVSVEETDIDNGVMFVRWTSPFDIDPARFPPPFRYELYRAEGFSGSAYQLVSGGRIADTTFVDSGLNTRDNAYNYRVVTYDNTGRSIDTTLLASSVRLEPTPITGAMELKWSAVVPWTNQSVAHRFHRVFRNNADPDDPGRLILIDSVDVVAEGFHYLDDGRATGENQLDDTRTYCYYVETKGSYGNPKVRAPLINRSQIICAQPNDTIPPCAPFELTIGPDCEEFLQGQPCEFDDFFNDLSWGNNEDPNCDQDVRSYNIYFSDTGEEGTFTRIANVTGRAYRHDNLPSFKGCYYLTSVDRSGNESAPTEIICRDNCPYYELPNVFTPNEDGSNDFFQAFNTFDEISGQNKCPRFVRSIEIRIYNRWGVEVYSNENEPEQSILIRWDGKTSNGRKVPSGIYYYHALVTFDVLDPALAKQNFKGWVHILY